MQITTAFIVAALSAVSSTRVSFHDGNQVPHARAATDEIHFNAALSSAHLRSVPDEIPSAKRRRVIPDEVPPQNGILAANPRYTDVALQRLKKRNEVLYFGLKHPEYRDVSFRYYNELREADGLEPRSYEEIVAEKKRRRNQTRLREAIVELEKRKPISLRASSLLKELKETQPVEYNSIKIRLKVRKEMDALSQKNSPLTAEESSKLESLSQQYERILKGHRKYFN